MNLDNKLYVLQAMGIGPNRVVGVFTTIEKAAEAAEEILPQTDGYHALELFPYPVDKALPFQFSYGHGRDYGTEYLDSQVEAIHTYVKNGAVPA